jgi:hypothetical protein
MLSTFRAVLAKGSAERKRCTEDPQFFSGLLLFEEQFMLEKNFL